MSKLRWLTLCGVLLGLSHAQPASPAFELLETTLHTLEENYYGYANFDGRERQTYTRALESACQNINPCPSETATPLLENMLEELNDPHTYLLSPSETQARERESSGQATQLSIGIQLEPVADSSSLLITRVRQNSPAWNAGLRRGDQIWKVNNLLLEQAKNSKEALEAVQRAETQAALSLEVSNTKTTKRSVSIFPKALGVWQPQLEIRNNIAILEIFQFKSAIATRVHALVREAISKNVSGIVLDLRDSKGGLVTEMLAVTSAFIEHATFHASFKTTRTRFEVSNGNYSQEESDGSRYIAKIVKEPTRFKGRIVILTSQRSKSAPEYVSYLLQRSKRARVVGEPTLGALNTTNTFYSLPDGSSLAVSVGRSLNENMQPFPSRVTPNDVLAENQSALIQGRDTGLERAFGWLENSTR